MKNATEIVLLTNAINATTTIQSPKPMHVNNQVYWRVSFSRTKSKANLNPREAGERKGQFGRKAAATVVMKPNVTATANATPRP